MSQPLIRPVRHCILFALTFKIFTTDLDQTADDPDSPEINFDILKASEAKQPEDTMFYQAYEQLNSVASQIFRMFIHRIDLYQLISKINIVLLDNSWVWPYVRNNT